MSSEKQTGAEMVNGNSSEGNNGLHGMSDREAIDIMEGRAPAHDSPQMEQEAIAIAEGLRDEDLDEDADKGGAGVPQPLLKMAAALLLGVIITSAVTVPTLQTTAERQGVSTNVFVLETYRGAANDSLQTVSLAAADPWITLIAYPDTIGAERLRIFVERAATEETLDWVVIMEDDAGVGTEDSVVVTVPAALFQAGIHRLRIDSEGANVKITGSTSVMFRISD